MPPAEKPLGRVVDPEKPARLGTTVPSEPVALGRLSGGQLKAIAAGGGFAVDENTGNRMIKALEAALDALESRWAELEKLQQNPPMSDSPAARWVAKHMVDTASDADGLLTQLRAARTEFPAYVAAIRLAKRTYQEAETGVSKEFHGIRRWIDTGEK